MPVKLDPHAMIWRCGIATNMPSLTGGAFGMTVAVEAEDSGSH